MNNQGRNIFIGINYQTIAAFALYLQYLNDKEFSYIQLEALDLSDFHLVFKNERKIICESKNYSSNLTDYKIKEILEKIVEKKNINDNDEILIICSKCNTGFFKEIKNLWFYKKDLEDIFRGKGFSEALINILQKNKINLWEIAEDLIEDIIFSLFYELVGFWLPDDEIKKIVHSIQIEKFYKGSAKGETYTRDDIFNRINEFSKKIKNDSTKSSNASISVLPN